MLYRLKIFPKPQYGQRFRFLSYKLSRSVLEFFLAGIEMIGKEKKWKEKKVAFIFHVLELKENERK
jgi:hypothetical protein